MTVVPPPHPKRSRGGRLISQGAYGCVYKPGLRCPNAPRGAAAAARGTVSKLQRAGRAASTEVAIGARIRQTMPRYAQRFAPVVESCAVRKTQLPEGTAEGCRAVKDDDEEEEEGGKSKNKNNNDLVIMRMPGAGEQTLGKYLSRRGRTLSQIGEAWRALRDAFVQLADDAGVVHFDFKGDNAMWSRARRAPVLIDFGLALYVPALLGDAPPLVAPVGSNDAQDADAALWRQGFFALHPAYASWCPEAVLCASLWQSEIRGPQEDGSESTESPDKDEADGADARGGGASGGGGGSAWRSTDKLGAPELEHMRAALTACFERHPTFKLLLKSSGEMIQPRLDARRAKLEAWVAAQSGRTRLVAGRDMLRRTWRKWDRFALAGTVLNALLRRRGISSSKEDQQKEFELLTSTLAEEALEM